MVKRTFGWSLLAVPLVLAMAGPLLAGRVESVGAPWQAPDAAHPLGTDVLGRDALTVILAGGFPVIGMTAAALALAYLIGVPLGLVAAGRGRLADETVMRSLDLVLAFPSLLVLMVLAATGHRGPGVLIPVVAVLQLPAITRVVRAAALAPGCRAAVEALTLQGQPWWRIQLGYVARHLAGPVATDAGTRLGVVLYLLASANFLGLGLPADSPDWAVVIERNSEALYTSPAVVLVPAALLMALCVGTNLVTDRLLAARRVIA
ncbi:ABC transporter permease [Amycolatopsis sp. WAC 04182]|uniref:ABC transporter permease n=1 Tax=Amycolatopsis sp. WAC 04182 TaxID=2203198 RepID=UPI000F7ACA90|nr:ABC transporter permease subunit [Amycolatopsis sp. WAC 04182]RSN55174.1 ABC transporter permease [Amycolatopsis sp. WAC 04182]